MLKATLPLSPTFGVCIRKDLREEKAFEFLFLFSFVNMKKKEREKERGYFPLKFKKGKRKRLLSFKIQKGESFHNGVLRHILSHLFSLVALPSLLAHGQGGPKRQGVLSLLSLGSKGLKSRPKYLPLTHKKTPPHA